MFPTKASGEKSLSYNDAVEEALCFGWIDGRAGTLDDLHQIRRFTPRRKGSGYSQPNIERLIWLDAHGLIHPKIRASVEEVIRAPFVFPEDILDAIRREYAQCGMPYYGDGSDMEEFFQQFFDNFGGFGGFGR